MRKYLLHVIPVCDDAVFDGVLQSKYASHRLRHFTHERLAGGARQCLVVLGSTDVRRKLDGRDPLRRKPTLTVATSVVENDGRLQPQRLK